ncbi:alpha/beta hydrolase family protein [Crateriforma spongiae]|uniref:alpha/beta hydrolase family protein n=1 Tax=Crateriforma spongiae TaxID=2724528 RepID=UPI001446F5E5|nr:S9 family peptidase [Crateriforma spongiae]
MKLHRQNTRVTGSIRSAATFAMVLLTACVASAERLTPERLWDLQRIGESAVSPDGSQLAFLVTSYDLEKNEGRTSLHLTSLDDKAVGKADRVATAFETPLANLKTRVLIADVKGLSNLAWLDHTSGPRLLYIAPAEIEDADQSDDDTNDADESTQNDQTDDENEDDESSSDETPQVFMLDPDGGDPVQLTHVAKGVGNLKAASTGDRIAFTTEVKLGTTTKEQYPDLPKADARVIDALMYRHWDHWTEPSYSHVHVCSIDEQGIASEPVDLMASLRANCPMPPFGGKDEFAFSPDGQEIALTLKLVNNPAESTDSNIYIVPTEGGRLTNITPGMPGYDRSPVYSPDGRYLAFHSMRRASFESDRNRIMIYNRSSGDIREVTVGLDQTAHSATWASDSRSLFFYSEMRGTDQVFRIDLEGQLQQISSGRFNHAIVDTLPGRDAVLVRQQSMLRPVELAWLDTESAKLTTITDVNGSIFKDLELPTVEQRFFKASDGKMIHNWVVLPPDYDPDSDRQWPMLTYCQGGPQGQIGQWFSYRWNFHMMASHGYVVLAVNRRGLPGFGREWNDSISGDWGGQAMQDILASTDAMMADPTIDPKRVAAIGASFGGYTVYWMMGNADDRFCSMVSHCGVFNLESMYGSTEELFFVNWDLGGPYWKSKEVAEAYKKFSPHQYVDRWKTPLLIIHGQRDYRVPVTQAMEAFTAAQVQGVPSRFLYFPDEGHWVLGPQNGVLWGTVFFDWLDKYCQPGQQNAAAADAN